MNTTVRRLGIVALLVTGSAIGAVPAAGAAGPYLVKDIDTNGASNPQQLTAVGSTLFFTATGGSKGRELFRSDGTPGGTVRVKDIRPGTSGPHPSDRPQSAPKFSSPRTMARRVTSCGLATEPTPARSASLTSIPAQPAQASRI